MAYEQQRFFYGVVWPQDLTSVSIVEEVELEGQCKPKMRKTYDGQKTGHYHGSTGTLISVRMGLMRIADPWSAR